MGSRVYQSIMGSSSWDPLRELGKDSNQDPLCPLGGSGPRLPSWDCVVAPSLCLYSFVSELSCSFSVSCQLEGPSGLSYPPVPCYRSTAWAGTHRAL